MNICREETALRYFQMIGVCIGYIHTLDTQDWRLDTSRVHIGYMTIVLSIENEFVLCDTLTLMKHRLSESDPMTWGSTAVPLWLPWYCSLFQGCWPVFQCI